MRSEYEHEVSHGFDIICRYLGVAISWAFYIVLFPVCYPLARIGRADRERAKREHEEYLARYREEQ